MLFFFNFPELVFQQINTSLKELCLAGQLTHSKPTQTNKQSDLVNLLIRMQTTPGWPTPKAILPVQIYTQRQDIFYIH